MNTPKYTTLKRTFAIDNKTDEGFDILEFNDLHRVVQEHVIRYAQLLDDYIYKNIPSNVLQGMKLKIENELMERRLKGDDT